MLDAESRARLVAELIRRHTFTYADEYELQAGIAAMLEAETEFAVQREVRLNPGDRIDLLVEDVGVEVKVGGSRARLVKQLARYADHSEIGALVLVSSRVAHMALPFRLGGKAVRTVWVGSL